MPSYPFDESNKLELDPEYVELIREPATKVQVTGAGEAWLLTKFEDVKTVLTDPRFSRADVPDDMLHAIVGNAGPQFRKSLSMMRPDDHVRLRKLAAGAFSARRVERLRPKAQALASSLLDEMTAKGSPADLIASLAVPMPLEMICELLGVPVEDKMIFHEWAETVNVTTAFTPEQIQAAMKNIYVKLAMLVRQRYADPRDDLLSALAQAREADDQLTEQEVLDLALSLLIAGYETTLAETGNFVYLLMTQPDRWRWLLEHRDQVPEAVEELLRIVPLSTLSMPITATEDVQLSCVRVQAGESVLADKVAANLDEEVFPKPDELDFERAANPHLTFSFGPHHCFGAPLARMELQVILGSLVDRFPGLRLAVPVEELPWKTGKIIRSLQELPIAW